MYVTSSKFSILTLRSLTKPSAGFVVIFAVTGDGIGSFQTVNFDLFKPEKEKLFVYISITLNADSVAPKVSFEPSFVC